MSNIVKFDENMKLPAHLKQLADSGMEEWESGQVSGFPVLSLKGKVFHIVRNGDRELITRPDDEDEPATSLELVILKTHKGVARTYYEDEYEEGSNEKPTCYSNDGVKPEDDAEEKQAKSCKVCPHSQWGSRITDAGKKGKACSEVKRLAVAEPGYEDDPMLLRIPPTSLTNWDDYLRKLDKKGMKPTMFVTKVSFDNTVSHQLLKFKPVGFIDDATAVRVMDMQTDSVVDAIIGKGPAIEPPVNDEEEDDAPPPKEKTRASRKQKADEEEEEQEEEEQEEAPKPSRRRRQAEPEEKPAKKRRADPDEEEEEQEEASKPSRRRKAAEPEEKPTRRRRQAAPEDEEEEDEPAPKPKKKPKEPATVVDGDDDLDAELDDMLGELDFDD